MTSPASRSDIPICPNCLGELLPVSAIYQLDCSHVYHSECMKPWMELGKFTCPLDRRRILSINGIDISRLIQIEERVRRGWPQNEAQVPFLELRLALQFATNALRQSRNFFREAIRIDSSLLEYASPELKDDNGFMMDSVMQDGIALQYGSQRIQSDPVIAMLAATQNRAALQFARDAYTRST